MDLGSGYLGLSCVWIDYAQLDFEETSINLGYK